MPELSVWMLRSSLLALLAGGGIGAWRLAGLPGGSGDLRAAHTDLMLFGWLLPFVLGVAYWILPRFAAAPERGSVRLAEGGAGLLLIGMALSFSGHLLGWPAPVVAAGRVMILGGVVVFGSSLWRRAKAFGAP